MPESIPAVAFEDYVNKWFVLYKSGIKETTKADYQYILHRYLLPAFGKTPIDRIATSDIQTLLNKHQDIAKSTVNKMILVLDQILKSALKDGLVQGNPVDRERIVNPSRIVHSRDALPEEAYFDILDHLHVLRDSDRRLLALMALTGMRRGEVLGLRWDDILFDKNLIMVRRNVTYVTNDPQVDTPKTTSGIRKIPLDERLVSHLIPRMDSGYIIGGDKPITKSSYRRAMVRIGKAIDLHGASAHIFRHTYATMLNNAGVNVKVIQAILGHSDISTTMNRYTHTSDNNILDAGKMISSYQAKNPDHES